MSSFKLLGVGNNRLDICFSLRIGEKGLLEPVELWELLSRRKVRQLLLILRHRQGDGGKNHLLWEGEVFSGFGL